jgi:hypothetical protein
MASVNDSDRATVDDLLAAATKLDHLADEMEHTGQQVGGAAAAAASVMPGFSMAGASVATCGHLNSVIAENVRQIRAQADHLRTTAAHYTELDHDAQTQVTIK